MMSNWERIWTFDTKRFSIILDCQGDDGDLSWADDETLYQLDRGVYVNVCFRVRVLLDGHQVVSDYLGDLVYENVADFAREHRDPNPKNRNTLAMRARNTVICYYFPEMVRQAVSSARKRLADPPRIRKVNLKWT